MGFQFPNSPTEGAIYTAASGQQYTYTNGVWLQTGFAYTPLKTAESYNRVVNGAMQHSQQNGNTVGNTSAYYLADQWPLIFSTTGAVNSQREPASTPTPYGSRYRIVAVVNTADTSIAAGEYMMIYQPIEGVRVEDFCWGTTQAKQVVLRFGCRAPAGTYAFSLINAADTRAFISMFTISAGQANTDTIQTIVIPGDTTGTWATDTGIGMNLQFIFAIGSTYNGGVAGWQA